MAEKMAVPENEPVALEFLKDATNFQMKKVNGYESMPPSKIFKIVSTDSVSYCCTVPNSDDLVIKDEKYGNNRFCIRGIGSFDERIYVYTSPDKRLGMLRESHVYVAPNETEDYWVRHLTIASRARGNGRYVYSINWTYSNQPSGSIIVDDHLVMWEFHISYSLVMKATLLAYGIHLALNDHRDLVIEVPPSNIDIDSTLWVDYTEQLNADEEAVPIDTLVKLEGEEFTLRSYMKTTSRSTYSFTLTDENNDVLLILHYSREHSGILSGHDVRGYNYLKCFGMNKNKHFIILRSGSLGQVVGRLRPPADGSGSGWEIENYLLPTTNPNIQLHTPDKFFDNVYTFHNLINQTVCTFTDGKFYWKIKLQKDMTFEEKVLLICFGVKKACHYAKLHTRLRSPVLEETYTPKYPTHLVRVSTGRKAFFPQVFNQFNQMEQMRIRPAFKVADEDSVYSHFLDNKTDEIIYVIRSKIGEAQDYCLPFETEVIDEDGKVVFSIHQPHGVATMIVNSRDGNNIGYYEYSKENKEEAIIETDDGDHLGKVNYSNDVAEGLFIKDEDNTNLAGIHTPCQTCIYVNLYTEFRVDQKLMIAAVAIKEAFNVYQLHQNLPSFPTLQA